MDMISEQDLTNAPDKKRSKEGKHVWGLSLGHAGVVCKVLRTLFARCGSKKAELRPFHAVDKRRWAWRGENVPRNGVSISSNSLIFWNSCACTERFGRFYVPWYFSGADLLKALVLQKLADNEWSELFTSARYEAACENEILISTRLRAKLC